MLEYVAAMPSGYPLRQYPDICHTIESQFEVPQWPAAFAFTTGREPVIPLPQLMSNVLAVHSNASFRPVSIGFGAYSEGVASDFNIMLWSALSSEPNTSLDEVVAQYAHYYFPVTVAGQIPSLLFGLERNWVNGPLETNAAVTATLATALAIAQADQIELASNWRLQVDIRLFERYNHD